MYLSDIYFKNLIVLYYSTWNFVTDFENYLFKPSPQIIDVYPHNFIFPPNLLKFEPFDFFDLIPFKFEPTNFNTLLKDSIEAKKSISIWKLEFFMD